MKFDIDVEKIIEEGSNENANLMYNPESIHKWIADEVMKQYALKVFPKDVVRAHKEGAIHLHDLEYAMIRPVCMQHDLRYVFKNGLIVDGDGRHTNVSKPAKRPEVAIQHAAKVMMAAQTNMSGGQSIDEFNVWLAPYMKGLDYDEVKQLMQMFIYELNQMYVARGGQTIFSSVNLEIEIPDYLKDKEVIKAGEIVGVYGDYEEESRMIYDAFMDVLKEGDGWGRPFLFPNTIVKVRKKSDLDEIDYELMAKYGTLYVLNMTADWQPDGNVNSMGCRTRLANDWSGDAEYDTLRTGNIQWYSLNLPRIGLESGGDEDRMYEILDERLELLKKALLFKWMLVRKSLKRGLMKFLEGYYRFEYGSLSIGFVGLNELVKYMTGYELHNGGFDFGYRVIEYMRKRIDEFKKETGFRIGLNQTPAESTAGRFAKLDVKTFKYEAKKIVNGEKGRYYYTNSSHVRYDSDCDIVMKTKIEAKFHPLCNAGHISHYWLGDVNSDAIRLLVERVVKEGVGYFTITKDLEWCPVHGMERCDCPDRVVYSKITGYLQAVKKFNDAKKEEWKDRRRYV